MDICTVQINDGERLVSLHFCSCNITNTMSRQCHFDPAMISQKDVLDFLVEVENSLPDTMADIEFPQRKIVFPVALDDRWNREALERYMSNTRSKAVYLPNNIDYLARNNGLEGGATEVFEKLMSNWVI